MKSFLLPAVFLCCVSGFAAPFQNLGFDEAVTNITEVLPPDSFHTGVGYGPASDLLPGWQVFRGGTVTPVEKVGLNIRLGLDIVSIYQVEENSFFDGPYYFGTVTPFFQSPERPQYSLVQRGDIPADANWISFKRNGDPVEVSINGTSLPLLEFSAIPGQILAGTIGVGDVIANISAFAGQNVELKLTHEPDILLQTYVDSIFFAAQVPQVPESSTLILSALGGIALFGIGRFDSSARSR